MEKILLHICCGVCSSSVVERLREEGYQPIGFFYNPNIHPQEEYLRREDTAKQAARILKFELIPASYDKDGWLVKTKGLENEPEGGRRCPVCFKMRLEETEKMARKMNIPKFTTTLSVSPHKNSAVINDIGSKLSPSNFLARDFKKHDGFKLAIEFSKRYNLYRQIYCGCIYSRNAKSAV
jgi:predicted adenine nucleotide alpha hydrolase (AANH) superfamily ATPase